MSHKRLTIVTGLLDIGRGEMNTSFHRPFEKYLECFEKLLQVDYPMIIYLDPKDEHLVWKHRKREDTHIIYKTAANLKQFQFYDSVQQVRNDPKWYGQAGWLGDSTQAKLELYNPLVMSKVFWLNDAALMNPHKTKYFCWIDGGIANTLGNPKSYLDDDFENLLIPHIKTKVNFLAFPYEANTEVHGFSKDGMKRYAGKDTEYVCRGGFFAGPADAIHKFNADYYQLLSQSLSEKLMGTEESVFTLLTYRNPKEYKIHMIDGNGLVYKFFQDLKDSKLEADPEFPVAIYALTYNLPQQFEMWAESFLKAYPDDFNKHKKYVINNSNDPKVSKAYTKLFEKYNFEVIHSGENIGINDGRLFCAEHFDKANHKYYVWFEDDDLLIFPGDNPADYAESPTGIIKQGEPCKNGFIRYIPNLIDKCIDILDDNDLDFLRLNHTEVYGDCHQNWGYKNIAPHRRDEIFPDNKDSEEMRWKTKIDYTGAYKGVSYAVGQFHYSNWPLLFCKRGNRQMFLTDKYDNLFEQTLSSLGCQYVFDGKMKVGCLLASPINHFRKHHYAGNTRRENKHYKN